MGGVCGGPLGLAIGLKAGAAIALGGGVLGYFGGRYFKKKQEEATDIQLDNLSSSREVKKYQWSFQRGTFDTRSGICFVVDGCETVFGAVVFWFFQCSLF